MNENCPLCGQPGADESGHYKGYHPECVMAKKQQVSDEAERAARGLPPNLTRAERRAKERRDKKSTR